MTSTIQDLIKKYRIKPEGNQIRVEMIQGADENELKQIKDAKQEILQYFRDQEEDKRKKEEMIFEKARRREDGLYLVINYKLGNDPYVYPARRLNEEEKKRYSEWFAKVGFFAVGKITRLEHINYDELPHWKPDGKATQGELVWIITPEKYDEYIRLNEERENKIKEEEEEERRKWEEKKAQYEKEKAEMIAKVDDWNITERDIYDEGGKTKMYRHRFLIEGETLSFVERNIFDFGVVINPDYEIAPGKEGGIISNEDGVLYWMNYVDEEGWVPARSLTEHEEICITIISKYGKFANAGVRM